MGAKVRALRLREGMTQRQLAERLEVSASYLNLIENNRRPLPAKLLLKAVQIFEVDLTAFSDDSDQVLVDELRQVFGDPVLEDADVRVNELKKFALHHPGAAQGLVKLYRAFRAGRDQLPSEGAAAPEPSVERGHLPSEEVNDFIQGHRNHFPELEDAAEALWMSAELDAHDLQKGLIDHLRWKHGVRVVFAQQVDHTAPVRAFDPDNRELTLSVLLPPRSRNFHLAHHVALLDHPKLLDRLVVDPALSAGSRVLGRLVMANYFAGAVLMPYERFVNAAREVRYDIELLGHRFRTSFEQVCHRLTTLQRRGNKGVPFHMVRVDIAGNINKRFTASGIHFARFSGACPRWNVFRAFLTPGVIRRQLSVMPNGDRYFCIARTLSRSRGGYRAPTTVHAIALGCRLDYAQHLTYADGVDVERGDNVEIGVTCRLCDRPDCTERAFPALQSPLAIDPNVRMPSFYMSSP